MKFTDTFIQRPVFATVLSLFVVLVGMISYSQMTLRQFPKVEEPTITINTNYSGASAELIEGYVTTPLEDAISSIDGLNYMTSSSRQGRSSITVHLKLGEDVDKASNAIRDKIASVRYKLPEKVHDPIVQKTDANDQPILIFNFASTNMTTSELTDYLTRVVVPQFSTIDGVGQAMLWGELPYAMRLWLNPELMAAHGVTALDIQKSLENSNVRIPSGNISNEYQEFSLLVESDLKTAEEFNRLAILEKDNTLIRLEDIGRAELSSVTRKVAPIINGKLSTAFAITAQSDANPLDVAKVSLEKYEQLKQQIPSDIETNLMWNSTVFIEKSLDEVFITIIESTLIVTAVIFLFVGSFRLLAVPIITVPISLIGVSALMHAMGFSLNTLTLLAWVLAIGLVVDDAIVVLENVQRHVEQGAKPFQAAIKGAREIAFPVIAMTLTLAAVYVPIGFKGDLTGALFIEFAFTLAGAVIVSGFIALTLSPMMCSKLLLPKGQEPWLQRKIESITHKLSQQYKQVLLRTFNFRPIILLLSLGVIIFGGFMYKVMPKELSPTADQGFTYAFVDAPSWANLNYLQENTNQAIEVFESIPEKQGYGLINGFPNNNGAIVFLLFKPWEERDRSASEIANSLFPQFNKIPGIRIFPVNPPALPISSGQPIQFIIKTLGTYDELYQALQMLTQAAQQNPNILGPRGDMNFDKPDIIVEIDRNRASDLGISAAEIGQSLNLLFGEAAVTEFTMNGRGYDVIPQLYPEFRDNPNKLDQLHARARNGELVPLSSFITISESIAPNSLNHFQQLRSATLEASLAQGYTLGEALDFLNEVVLTQLPDSIQTDYAGESRQFIETSGGAVFTILLALVFIYLVLSAQFESWRDPLIILVFSVPLTLTWGLLTVYFLVPNGTWNIYTEISMVTLIGLISKHGILITEFANHLQLEGKSIKDAAIEAATVRLRPILMTSAAIILAVVPLAIATGAGAEARNQIGMIIIGGMVFGTLFTLFVVPIAYSYLARKKERLVEVN